MAHKHDLIRAVLPLLLAGASFPLFAAPLYCCKDDNGRKVCADRVPPQCIGRDYTVRTERGTKVVEGMLTREERALREIEAKKKKEADEARMEQRRKDQALRNTYASEKDIDIAKGRAEKDITDTIKQAESKIEAAEKRKKKFEGEGEFYKNKALPDDVRRGIKDAEFEIKAQGELIEAKQKELGDLETRFVAEKKRYREIQAVPR